MHDVSSCSQNFTTLYGLLGDTDYRFSVSAINSEGDSAQSNASVDVRTLKVPPSPPGQPKASNIQQYAMKLSWSAPTKDGGYPIEGYKIWRRISGTSDWVVVSNNTESDVPEYNVIELVGYTAYEFKVAGINFLGVGDNSGVSESARTLPIPPDPPSRPLVFAITGSSFSFKWAEPDARGSAITAYRCELSQNGAGFTVFYVAGATETEYIAKGLEGTTNYQVRVTAINGIGDSNPSEDTPLITLDPVLPDPPIETMVKNMTPPKVKFSWSPPDDFGGRPLLGYNVSYAVDGEAYRLFGLVESNTTYVELDRLLGSTTYMFKVEAINEIGRSEPAVRQHTTLAPIVPAAPGAPVVSDIQQCSVRLDWDLPGHDGGSRLTGFKIYADWEGSWVFMHDVFSGSQNFTTLSGLLGDTDYRFSVSAINSEGDSAQSNASVDVRTLRAPPFPPGASTGTLTAHTTLDPVVSAAPGAPKVSNIQQYSVALAWAFPEQNGGAQLTGFNVYGEWEGQWVLLEKIANGSTNAINLTRLIGHTDYRFAVSAITSAGESARSDAAVARTLKVPPLSPSVPTPTEADQHSIKLVWAAPANDGGHPIQGYRIWKRVTRDRHWERVTNDWSLAVSNTQNDSAEFKITDLEGFTDYEFVVAGINELGVGDCSRPSIEKRTHFTVPESQGSRAWRNFLRNPNAWYPRREGHQQASRRCAQPGCPYARTWHESHCCKQCVNSSGATHGQWCDKKWANTRGRR